MTLHRSLSIKNVLRKLFDLMREIDPDLSLVAVTPEAVCKARNRLGIEPMDVLFNSLAGEVKPAPCFLGLRPWGYDGVRFTLPDTPENEKEFARPKASRGKAAFPQMLAVALVDTETRQVRDFSMGRCTDSERALARKFLKHLGPEDLVMMDRGCSSVGQFAAFTSTGAHVLGRISSNWKPRKIRRLSDGSWLVEVMGYDDTLKKRSKKVRQKVQKALRDRRRGKRRKKKKLASLPRPRIVLQMRMIEYRIARGEKCRLLTDLLDPVQYPARELALGYHRRWECELAYDELKTHLATVTHGTLHTVFRSKTPDGVRQEAFGTFIAYNLVRRLIAEAGEAHGVPPLDISFVEALEVIKMAAPRFERASKRQRAILFEGLLQDLADCRNKRPRRPRRNRREVKIKMTKFPLKRRRGAGKTIAFAATLRLPAPPSSGCPLEA